MSITKLIDKLLIRLEGKAQKIINSRVQKREIDQLVQRMTAGLEEGIKEAQEVGVYSYTIRMQFSTSIDGEYLKSELSNRLPDVDILIRYADRATLVITGAIDSEW